MMKRSLSVVMATLMVGSLYAAEQTSTEVSFFSFAGLRSAATSCFDSVVNAGSTACSKTFNAGKFAINTVNPVKYFAAVKTLVSKDATFKCADHAEAITGLTVAAVAVPAYIYREAIKARAQAAYAWAMDKINALRSSN